MAKHDSGEAHRGPLFWPDDAAQSSARQGITCHSVRGGDPVVRHAVRCPGAAWIGRGHPDIRRRSESPGRVAATAGPGTACPARSPVQRWRRAGATDSDGHAAHRSAVRRRQPRRHRGRSGLARARGGAERPQHPGHHRDRTGNRPGTQRYRVPAAVHARCGSPTSGARGGDGIGNRPDGDVVTHTTPDPSRATTACYPGAGRGAPARLPQRSRHAGTRCGVPGI